MKGILSVLVLLVGTAAHGEGNGNGQGQRGGPPTFAQFDLNGDGQLTEAEFYEARGQRIAERAAEGRQMKHLPEAPLFTDIDLDGNGAIDPAEFSRHQSQHRARMDVQKTPENPDNG